MGYTQSKQLWNRIPALPDAFCRWASSNGKIAPALMDEALLLVIAVFSNDDHTPNNVAHVHNRFLVTYNAPLLWTPLTHTSDNKAR